MSILRIDIETFSKCDLKKCGVYKYAEDESTELLSVCFAFDDEPVQVWLPFDKLPANVTELIEAHPQLANREIIVNKTVPARIRQHIQDGGIVGAFNAQFERVVLSGTAGKKVNFPKLLIRQMRCTAVKSRESGMPENLGDACNAMGTYPKSEAGHLVMLQLSRPRKPSKENTNERWTWDVVPDKFLTLWAYNVDDVEAERDLDKHLPKVDEDEWGYWFMDQEMNDRGVYVDLPAVDDFQVLIDEYKRELEDLCLEKTGLKPTQSQKLAEWVRTHGYPGLSDLQADTVNRVVKGKDCPDDVKVILRLYNTYNMKAVSKYKSLVAAACKDGRIRGMFSFYGAATTGRWSSKIVQLQNLFRPVIEDCDSAIEAVAQRDLQWIKILFDVDPMKVFASCIRGMLRAKPEAKLFAIDYSGIESRYVAWLFDENWKLKVFRDYDTIIGKDAKGKLIRKGPDNYTTTYSALFGVPLNEITKAMRQIGKPIELSLAYEGGVGAFVTMAANYKVDLKEMTDTVWSSLDPEALDSAEWMWNKFGKGMGLDKKIYLACDAIKWMWRQKHPKIVQGWKDLKNAAISAVLEPGEVFAIPNKKVMYKVVDRWLVLRLPSGRKLRCFEPRVEGEGKDAVLTYLGVDTDTRRWMRTSTYGGKECEHVCQGGSSDFIRYGMKQLAEEGYPLIMTVHDEAGMECDQPFHNLKVAEKIYTRKQAWAKDFPLAAEGFEAIRFRK